MDRFADVPSVAQMRHAFLNALVKQFLYVLWSRHRFRTEVNIPIKLFENALEAAAWTWICWISVTNANIRFEHQCRNQVNLLSGKYCKGSQV